MVGIRVNPDGPGDIKRAYIDFWVEMRPHVARAVVSSFVESNMNHPTQDEMKRRSVIAKKLVDECRNDLKWSKQEIIAKLPALLRSKLVGTKDPRDERQREQTRDGFATKVYSVDPAAAVHEKELRPSEVTLQKFEKELPEQDLAGEDDDEKCLETADPEDLDPPPPATP